MALAVTGADSLRVRRRSEAVDVDRRHLVSWRHAHRQAAAKHRQTTAFGRCGMHESNKMELVVDAGGSVRCIYGEEFDLRELGRLQITRASHVETDAEGSWWADMGPSVGPMLGPSTSRSQALEAERIWLMCGRSERLSSPGRRQETMISKSVSSAAPVRRLVSTGYRVLTTIVFGMLSCQPLGGVPRNENASKGMSLQKVLPTICPSVGGPPS